MSEFTLEIQEKINHIYAVGAGRYVLNMMSEMCHKIPTEHSDYMALTSYLDALEMMNDFDQFGR